MRMSEDSPRVLGLARRDWAVAALVLVILAAVAALLPPRGTPGLQIADLGESWALLLHGLGYAFLAFCAMLGQRYPRGGRTAMALIIYGVVLELLQGLGGVRSPQIVHALANAAGVGAGVWVAVLVVRSRA